MKTLYLVRHGTVYNPSGVSYRRLPGFYLSEQGRAEAQLAAESLRGIHVEMIYHSPLDRTVETAHAISTVCPAEATVCHDIIEWEVDENPDIVSQRMLSFWAIWMAEEHECAVAVSHRDPCRALLHSLRETQYEWTDDHSGPFPMPPATVYRIVCEGDEVRIEPHFSPVLP